MNSDSVKILLFLAQGFEDLEAVSVIDVFGWTQYRRHIPTAEVITTSFHPTVKGRYGLKIKPDIEFDDVRHLDFRAMVVPGGFHSHGFNEAYDPRLYELANKIHQNDGFIATMCVGVLPIGEAGLLEGKRATTYPHSMFHKNFRRLKSKGAIVTNKDIVVDNRIISCKGPGSSLEVAFLLMECLMGPSVVKKVKKYMVYER